MDLNESDKYSLIVHIASYLDIKAPNNDQVT